MLEIEYYEEMKFRISPSSPRVLMGSIFIDHDDYQRRFRFVSNHSMTMMIRIHQQDVFTYLSLSYE